MDWARRKIGLLPPIEQVKKEEDASVEREQLLKKDMFELKKVKILATKAQGEAIQFAQGGKANAAKQKLLERDRHNKAAAILENKIANQQAIQNSISEAESNNKHVLLLANGAEQLKESVQKTEDINLDAILDDIKGGMQLTEQHNNRLSEPLFVSSSAILDEDQIDDELAAMMAKNYNMPDAPSNDVRGGGGKILVDDSNKTGIKNPINE